MRNTPAVDGRGIFLEIYQIYMINSNPKKQTDLFVYMADFVDSSKMTWV